MFPIPATGHLPDSALVWRCLAGVECGPTYLLERCCSFLYVLHHGSLSSSRQGLVRRSRTSLTQFCTLSVAGLAIWNGLPVVLHLLHRPIEVTLYPNLKTCSFIPDIYIAPLQETYSEALSIQLRSKRNILTSLEKEDTLF